VSDANLEQVTAGDYRVLVFRRAFGKGEIWKVERCWLHLGLVRFWHGVGRRVFDSEDQAIRAVSADKRRRSGFLDVEQSTIRRTMDS
jgi:hypothetical protein